MVEPIMCSLVLMQVSHMSCPHLEVFNTSFFARKNLNRLFLGKKEERKRKEMKRKEQKRYRKAEPGWYVSVSHGNEHS